MRILIAGISILSILLLQNSLFSQEIPFKIIRLHKGEVSVKVPKNWVRKENAMRFAVYEIKYNVELKDNKSGTSLFLYVYDSTYSPKMQINDSIVLLHKQGLYSHTAIEARFLDSGIKLIGKSNVGYLKYTYLIDKAGGRAYEIDLFFCNMNNIYYKIEINCRNSKDLKLINMADKIFESISLTDF